VRSRRNYREGLLFCIGTFCLMACTVLWALAFAFIPDWYGVRYREIILCAGLILIPTALLVAIFVPKCYLMQTPPFRTGNLLGGQPRTGSANGMVNADCGDPAFSPSSEHINMDHTFTTTDLDNPGVVINTASAAVEGRRAMGNGNLVGNGGPQISIGRPQTPSGYLDAGYRRNDVSYTSKKR